MPRISEESIQKVADASDIVEIIGEYFSLKRAGTSFRALCPFHKEKSPSFLVNPARQSFHCFGCGAGGGVFRFVMDYEHVDFPSAVRKLAQRSGIVLIEDSDPKEQSRRDQRSRLLELHKGASAWFHANLLRTQEAEHARSYLKKRGLTKETVVEWQLGYAPAGWEFFRNWGLSKGFSLGELFQSGLLTSRDGESKDGYDRFRDRLMFPIRNDYGEVVAFSGRILNDTQKEAKYVNSPETPIFSKGRVLFGLDKSRRALVETGEAIVLEGQIDLISAFVHGVKNVVAPQGTAFTTEQARLLRRFAERVILCFDSDTAGKNAVERSLPALFEAGVEVRVAKLPSGEDPDSLIRGKGADTFRQCLADTRDFFDHTIEVAIETSGGGLGHRERATLAGRLGGYLDLIPDATLKETTTAHVATRLGVSESTLQKEVEKHRLRISVDDAEPPAIAQGIPLSVSASTELICRLSLLSQEVRDWIMSVTSPTPSELDPELSILAELIPPLQGLGIPSPSTILALIPSHLQPLVSGWELEKTPPAPLPSVQDAFRGLRLIHLKKKQASVILQLRQKGLSPEQMVIIQKEILDLQAMINDLSAPAS